MTTEIATTRKCGVSVQALLRHSPMGAPFRNLTWLYIPCIIRQLYDYTDVTVMYHYSLFKTYYSHLHQVGFDLQAEIAQSIKHRYALNGHKRNCNGGSMWSSSILSNDYGEIVFESWHQQLPFASFKFN